MKTFGKTAILLVMTLTAVSSFSQESGTWRSGYLNRDFTVCYDSLMGKYVIELAGEYVSDERYMFLDRRDRDYFVKVLELSRDRYSELKEECRRRGTTRAVRDIPYIFDRVLVFWIDKKGLSGHATPVPRFVQVGSGRFLLTLFNGDVVKSSGNEYIDTRIYLMFQSEEEIDSFVSLFGDGGMGCGEYRRGTE